MQSIDSPAAAATHALGSPADQRPTSARYVVLALAVVMAVLLYLDRYALSVVTPEIMKDLSINESEMGGGASAFFFAYALGQVPAGWLADRLGPRRALTLYVAAWSVAIAGVALSRTLGELVLARGMLGLSQAGAYPAAAGMIKKWMPFERRGFASGAVSMGGRSGNLLANIITPQLMAVIALVLVGSQVGLWRPVLILYALLGLVWAAAFGVWFRNTPREHASVNSTELALIEQPPQEVAEPATNPVSSGVSTRSAAATAIAIASSLNVWLLCLVNFFVNVGWIFLATWLATYLRKVHHISAEAAGWLTAGTALAGMAGCVTGGWATDRLVRGLGLVWGRRAPAILSLGGAAVAYLACYAGQESMATVIGVMACAYFLSDLVLGTVWATAQDIGGSSVGVLFGLANMCGNLGAGYFTGRIGDLAKEGNWSQVMLIASGSFAAGMVCWFFIDPRVPIDGSTSAA